MKKILQILLGMMLCYTGVLHLTSKREEFQAQVPSWLPIDSDLVVVLSGIIEITLGLSLLLIWRYREEIGLTVAAFFIAIFPGNIWQYVDKIDAFGLNSDRDRAIRLLFQPFLVLWALWSTDAHQRFIVKKRDTRI